MSDAPPALEDAQTSGPGTDWRATRSAWILGFLSQVLEYGRGLLADLRQRDTDDAPPAIAYQFGAVSLSLIIARITRGIILATALQERVTRSARRLDAPLRPRQDACSQTTTLEGAESACATQPGSPEDTGAANPDEPASAHAACFDEAEGARTGFPEGACADSPERTGPDSPERPERQPFDEEAELRNLPSAKEIAERIRRKPIGDVLVEICRDVGINAQHPLWRDVFKLITFNGGNFTRLFGIVMNRTYAAHELGVPLPPLPPSAQSLLAILNGVGPPFDDPPALATTPP